MNQTVSKKKSWWEASHEQSQLMDYMRPEVHMNHGLINTTTNKARTN